METQWPEAFQRAFDRLAFLLDLPAIVADWLGLGALLPVLTGVALGLIVFLWITGRERPRPSPYLRARRQLERARRLARTRPRPRRPQSPPG